MSHAAAYVRVSNRGQKLEGQRDALEKSLGNATVVWYEDKATGRNTDRPGFKALQTAIEKGMVKTVYAYCKRRSKSAAV
jgi:DNA invertase Pin-like site-specific DNA recombinase